MFFITISLRISQISFLKLFFIIASPGSLFQTFFFLKSPHEISLPQILYIFVYLQYVWTIFSLIPRASFYLHGSDIVPLKNDQISQSGWGLSTPPPPNPHSQGHSRVQVRDAPSGRAAEPNSILPGLSCPS